jgi:NAD(P)-dependent dehydrogenase (short-subunit alcohol dehydrogenase family)
VVKGGGGLRVFDGATAVITGGGSGIGRALAEALAEQGCRVVVADIETELVEETASTIRSKGYAATAIHTDVRSFDEVKAAVAAGFELYGRLDYMFNNAGIGAGGELFDHTIEAWEQVLAVNLRGVIHGVQAAYPRMREQGFGHIVNTASMAGLMASPLTGSYSTTKHAVVGLSKALRAEAHAAGLRVSVLCPGVIRTPILEGGLHGFIMSDLPPERQRQMSRELFERVRPMDPSEFAHKALRQVARNRPIIILPTWWKALWWFGRAFPSLELRLAAKLCEANRKEIAKRREAPEP